MTDIIRTNITCRKNNGRLDFYACFGSEKIFLFTQKYDRAVFNRFGRGVELGRALTPIKCRGRRAPIEKVSDKLPAYIRYIEQEYGVILLRSHFTPDNRRTLKIRAEENELRYAA